MKKTALLLAAALAACGGQKTELADSIRAALPAAQAIRIDAPNPSGAASPTALTAQHGTAMTADGKSDLAVVSYIFATAVNLGVGLTLAQLEIVTLFPPTSCTADSCTWGPGSSPGDLNDWMLVVTRNGDGYDYALSGSPKSAPVPSFVTVIGGTAYPGPRAGYGHGTMQVFFDAAATLDHPAGWTQTDFGTMTATYDARGPLALTVVWRNAKNSDPGAAPDARANSFYDFDQGARDLVVAWQTLPTNDPAAKSVSLHTRWTVAGAGRADLQATQNPLTYQESECWDGAPGYLEVYDNYDASGVYPTPNDPGACAFTPAAFAPIPDFATLP